MSLNAPLTSQNEIDRLAEVIAPSPIFFGRKYCYRQIGDSISGRRWGSRLWSKGCFCPILLRSQCLMMLYLSALPFLPHTLSLSFCICSLLFLSPTYSLCLFHFLRHCFITYYPNNISLTHPSILPWPLFLGSFFDHFCLLTIFVSLKRKTILPSSQQVMPPPSPQIVSLLPVWWCNVDIFPKDSIDLG